MFDAGALWHANNVMSWSHAVASFVVLLSHSWLAPIGVISHHDCLRGDQAWFVCFGQGHFHHALFSVCFQLQDHSGCRRLQFRLNRQLREGRRVLLFSIRISSRK